MIHLQHDLVTRWSRRELEDATASIQDGYVESLHLSIELLRKGNDRGVVGLVELVELNAGAGIGLLYCFIREQLIARRSSLV